MRPEDDDKTVHTRVVRRGEEVVAVERRLLRLTVKRGPDKGLKWQGPGERVVIGSHRSCDVALQDPTVSRQHCEIVLVPEGYLVRDLDSTNGTLVEGLRLGEATVEREARLHLGDTELAMMPLDDTVDLPLSASMQFGPLLGRSVAMRRVFDQLARLAPADITVLLTGESGTGKELAAQALHEASPRRGGPFRVVDCGSLPATLIESELFGHVRGAFTGADRARQGAFEDASGGTLFLDEIGELPLDLQTRLLGAIERRQILPLGSSHPRSVDVRFVAATNRNLRREVNRGTFREDLFFRLAVGVVEIPPLRDRPEDIPLYVQQFLEGGTELDEVTMARLQRERWPGNVRELRNAVERIVALGDSASAPELGDDPDAELPSLSVRVDPRVPYKTAKGLLVERYERAYVEELMRAHKGNITQAARGAELDRVYLLRLLDKFGLRPRR